MTSIAVRVDGADQAGEARRKAAALSASLSLDETTAGRLAIVVIEAANNLWKHAKGGEIVLTPMDPHGSGVEVLALDRGPGMEDVERCYVDGYSTAGSSGTGLGAIRRLANEYDVYTVPGKGTALLACVRPPRAPRPAGSTELGGLSVPIRGESVCGDDFAFHDREGAAEILVVDGLGHGPIASDCATAAVEAFRETRVDSPSEALRELHGALRATRGAAVVVSRIDWDRGEAQYSGIGNIAGFLWSEGKARHMVSHPGIVGHDIRNVRELTLPLDKNVLVLLHSDGIATHWSLGAYPGLTLRHPSLIAGVIYRDHCRGRDDATVVVARWRSAAI
jgi:anti-sigma regulatory factor (Ser/Thr protein kinase)